MKFRILLALLFVYNSIILYSQTNKTDSLTHLLKTTKEDTLRCWVLSELVDLSQPEQAKHYNKQLKEVVDQNLKSISVDDINYKTFKKYEVLYTINAGDFEADNGEYPTAIAFLNTALALSKEIQNDYYTAYCFNDFARIYELLGKYDLAIQNYYGALKIAEKMGDKSAQASIYNNIGLIQQKQLNADPIEYYKKSLELFTDVNEKRGMGPVLNNMASYYYGQGEDSLGAKYLNKSLQTYRELNDRKGVAECLNEFGSRFIIEHQPDSALLYYEEALKIRNEINYKDGVCNSYANIGGAYMFLNKIELAKKYLDKSLQMAYELKSPRAILYALKILKRVSIKSNDYKNALNYYELYNHLMDSTNTVENERALLESKISYDFEKKALADSLKTVEEKRVLDLKIEQKQTFLNFLIAGIIIVALITILFVRQYRANVKQRQLMLEQRLLRSQMNPHFIFNSLGAIQSYVLDNDIKSASSFLGRFSKLMRRVLESSVNDYISLNDEVSTLENYLELQKLRYHDRFNYSIEVDPAIDKEEALIPPMLTQPFIENAIEHGMKHINNGGYIKTTFGLRKDGEIRIQVEDNGIGITTGSQIKAAEEYNSHKSMALDITKERLNILNRKTKSKITFEIVDLKNEANSTTGTKVIFIIPLNKPSNA